MKDKVLLLIQYIQKEMEKNREFDEEEGIDVNSPDYIPSCSVNMGRIESFIKYKRIRTEEYYFANLTRGNNSKEVREERVRLDTERRRLHNGALTSLMGFNAFGEKNGLPSFYDGKSLTPEEIERHGKNEYDRIKEMTDFFLNLINEISNISIEKLFDKSNSKNLSFLQELQKGVNKVDTDYGVLSPLKEDDGNIEFKEYNEKNIDMRY